MCKGHLGGGLATLLQIFKDLYGYRKRGKNNVYNFSMDNVILKRSFSLSVENCPSNASERLEEIQQFTNKEKESDSGASFPL